MPGFALVAGERSNRADFTDAALSMMRPGLALEIVADVPGVAVAGVSSYDGYPWTLVASGDDCAALDGGVYDLTSPRLQADLGVLLEQFAANPAGTRIAVERWARARDGDFILALICPRREAALVINDTLGRLPVYMGRNDRGVVLARELKFARRWGSFDEPDRHAVAQSLIFGWPLGRRTFARGVSRMREATSVAVDLKRADFDVRSYHAWNFEELDKAASQSQVRCGELAEAFIGRCHAQTRWAANRPIAVALSGGLDSRAALAGFVRAGAHPSAVTFVRGDSADRESDLARRVAGVLGAPHFVHRLAASTWEDFEELADIRDGNNYIGVAFMCRFLEAVVAQFGRHVCYVSGDGGDRILADLRGHSLHSIDAFVDLRLSKAIWPHEIASKLVGISTSELVDRVKEHFASYPERSSVYWGPHFELLDRCWNGLFDGEERNRAYVWSLSPFYCQSFYQLCLKVPWGSKRHHSLYAEFMRALDPGAARLPNASWGGALGSPRARATAVARDAFDRLPIPIQTHIKSRLSAYRPAAIPRSHRVRFQSLIATLDHGLFDKSAMTALGRSAMTQAQFDSLTTAILYETRRSDVAGSSILA